MKSTQKLSELKGVTALTNPEDAKGGFFFLLPLLFGGYKSNGYQSNGYQSNGYQVPQSNNCGGGYHH